MKRSLVGRTVVVTGGARGIGEGVARLAAARGVRVGLIGLEPVRLREVADDLGSGALWWEADVRDSEALRMAIDDCAVTMGVIDFLVANAGVASYGTIRQADEASFERVLDVNLIGVFRTLKYATPHLERSGGHVLVVASPCPSRRWQRWPPTGRARRVSRCLPWHTARRWHTSASPSVSCTLPGSTPTWSAAPMRTSRRSLFCAGAFRIRAT